MCVANITDGNWAAATQVSGEPAPQIAGTAESMTVSGLLSNTIYYFALKISDEAPNTSGLSNIAVNGTADGIAPAAIKDLTAVTGTNRGEITLSWTAPGDDGDIGLAHHYLLRYAEFDFSDSSWEQTGVTIVNNAPVPQAAGGKEELTLPLNPTIGYYFRIKAADEANNTSAIDTNSTAASAVARANTAPEVKIEALTGTQKEDIAVGYSLKDYDGDNCQIQVEYSIDNGQSYKIASQGAGSEGLVNLTASRGSWIEHLFVWDSKKDLGTGIYPAVKIRITPSDSYGSAGAATSSALSVNNAAEQTICYPNPFNPGRQQLTLQYWLDTESEVDLAIYDLLGNLVKSQQFNVDAGMNQISWDGRNGAGDLVASGGYIAVLSAGGKVHKYRILVVE